MSGTPFGQQNRQLPRYGVDFDPIDSVKSAEACGVEGLVTDDPAELATAARRAVDENRPIVIEVPVDSAAYKGIV